MTKNHQKISWRTRKTRFLLSNSTDFKCQLKFRMKYPGYSSSYCFHVTSPDSAVEEETWTFFNCYKSWISFQMDFSIQKYLRTSRERKSDFKRLILIGSKISLQMEPTKNLRKMCKIQDQGTMGSYQFWRRLHYSIPAFSRDICSIWSLNSRKRQLNKNENDPSEMISNNCKRPSMFASGNFNQDYSIFTSKRYFKLHKMLHYYCWNYKTGHNLGKEKPTGFLCQI